MGRWWTDDLPYPFNDIADGFRETGHDRRARKANEDWTYFRMIKWIGKNNGCETEEVFTQIYPETTSLFYMVTDEQKERFQGLLMRLREEGWLREEKREEQQSAWFYLTGEGDERWDEKNMEKERLGGFTVEDHELEESKRNIDRMLHGYTLQDKRVLDYLCAHEGERFLVRELLARVFGEEEKVTSKMVRNSLEWLTEKELATVEEDENGRLLFRAAPEAEAHAQTQE